MSLTGIQLAEIYGRHHKESFSESATYWSAMASEISSLFKSDYSYIQEALQKYVKRKEKLGDSNEWTIITNGKEYTLEQLLDEVEQQTEFGRQIVSDLIVLTVDLLLRKKIKINNSELDDFCKQQAMILLSEMTNPVWSLKKTTGLVRDIVKSYSRESEDKECQ